MKTNMEWAGLALGGAVALSMMLAGNVRALAVAARFNYRVPVPAEPANYLVKPAAASVVAPLLSELRMHLPTTMELEPRPLPVPVSSIPYAPTQIIHAPARPVVHPTTPAVLVPDGGSTGAMLGLVVGGLACWRKKLKG